VAVGRVDLMEVSVLTLIQEHKLCTRRVAGFCSFLTSDFGSRRSEFS
jgi:hypothetical protein